MKEATLILEGGATRGVFSSGALDYLMEQDLYMSHVIGVSVGSCNAVDYVSKQAGRTKDCMIQKEKEYSYHHGLRKFVKEKSLLDMDMIFDKFPNEVFPFDYETYFASRMKCEIVVTNCITGKAEYLTADNDKNRLMKLCRASSSMPLVSPIVNIDQIPYLDGGLADSIPLARANSIGNEKIVIILTRNPGYRKKQMSRGIVELYKRAYKKYPALVETIRKRFRVYNDTMDKIERLEDAGGIFVLRPQIKTISRLEKDYDVILNFYEHGYKQMEKQFQNMLAYLEK